LGDYESGVFRSDLNDLHMFVLQTQPVRVTCVICMEDCFREDYKMFQDFKVAAQAFVAKHGALGERITDSLINLLPPRLPNPKTSLSD
jgi:hypothetical protein